MWSRTPGSFGFFVKAPSSEFMEIRASALESLLLLPSLPTRFWKTAIRELIHCGSGGKSICLWCGRPGFDSWVGNILWRRKWQPTPVLLSGKSLGWRRVVGYSPWGRKESDMTEQLHVTLVSIGLDTSAVLERSKVCGCERGAVWWVLGLVW